MTDRKMSLLRDCEQRVTVPLESGIVSNEEATDETKDGTIDLTIFRDGHAG